MDPTIMLLLAILAPAAGGVLTLALPRAAVGARVLLACSGAIVPLVIIGLHVREFGFDTLLTPLPWLSDFRLDLALRVDQLSAFFALLVAGIGLLITLYARAYFGPDPDALYRFYPSLHFFMTAMIGLALSDSLILMLLFWEMTSISSFLLIGWERDDSSAVKKALQAFVVTGAGGLSLLGGLILLGTQSGVWTFTELFAVAPTLELSGPVLVAVGLIFVGAAAKSAQWPLHFWLPGAMAAPTPVSAYLHSATMVKAGVYLTGRLYPVFASAWLWPVLIVPIGAFTMVLGAYIALRKTDLKQIFAYTTVSQLGLLMTMYGLSHWTYNDQPVLIFDITQILNHALYKAPLFILAGAVAHVAHTRELPELRGLVRLGGQQRVLAVLLVAAAYAMAAGPFTLSFAAKELFFYQIANVLKVTQDPVFWTLVAAGVLTGIFNVAIFVRLTRTLLGPLPASMSVSQHVPDEDHETHDPHHAHQPDSKLWQTMLWAPAAVLLLVQYVGGIIPGTYESMFGLFERSRHYFETLPLTLDAKPGLPLYMSVVAIVVGVLVGLAPVLRGSIRDVHDALFPGFYLLCTRGGGRVFGLIQTGNARFYMLAISVMLVALPLYAGGWEVIAGRSAVGPTPVIEDFEGILPGLLIIPLTMLAAALMPVIKRRASRVLVLGSVGYLVTGIFYLFNAPDLALTQISIEIVSLILFLLALSLLPRTVSPVYANRLGRLALSVAVGLTIGWVAYSSFTTPRPPPAGHAADAAVLGEYFLRNSYLGQDMPPWPGKDYGRGGGGNNVVNVILVDFRGHDTLGEIVVLGLAAMGVWTLLRRPNRLFETSAVRRNAADHPAEPDPDAIEPLSRGVSR